MTPVHAALVRGPRRERAHHDQRPNDGRRHPGADVAAIGIDAAASASSSCAFDVDPRAAVGRVTIRRTTLEIQFAEGMTEDAPDRVLVIPWTPPSPYRRREIIQGEGEQSAAVRPMRTKARAVLIDALRDAHRWLDEHDRFEPHSTIRSTTSGKHQRPTSRARPTKAGDSQTATSLVNRPELRGFLCTGKPRRFANRDALGDGSVNLRAFPIENQPNF